MGWTDESVEKLRQLWMQGLTANEIAKQLGVTKNAIVGKVHRLCLTARPSPIKVKDEVEENIESQEVKEGAACEFDAKVAAKQRAEELTNIKLVDLDSHTCRWPIGDPRDDDFCFCGKKVRSGQTYCDEHSVMAYVKALKK
jgi:GcrA cell cycle regulator